MSQRGKITRDHTWKRCKREDIWQSLRENLPRNKEMGRDLDERNGRQGTEPCYREGWSISQFYI